MPLLLREDRIRPLLRFWLAAGLLTASFTKVRFPGLSLGLSEGLMLLATGLALMAGLVTKPVLGPGGQLFLRFWALASVCLLAGLFTNLARVYPLDLAGAVHDGLAFGFGVLALGSYWLVEGDDRAAITKLLDRIYRGSVVFCGLLLLLLALGLDLPVYSLYDDYHWRFTGLSHNPNQLALYLLPLPFVGEYLTRQDGRNRRYLGLLAILGVGALTWSDSVYLAWGLGGGYFLLVKRYARTLWADRLIKLTAIGTVLGVAGWLLPDLLDYLDTVSAGSHQGAERLNRWQFAGEAIRRSPLWGYGPGAFAGTSGIWQQQEAHNTVLDWTLSAGVLGACLLLWLWAQVALSLWQAGEWGLLVAFGGLLFFALFHYVLRQPIFWFYTLAFLSLTQGQKRWRLRWRSRATVEVTPSPRVLRMTTVPASLRHLLRGQMAYLRSQGFTVAMASAAGPEVDELVSHEGCPHYALPLTRRPAPWRDLRALWATYRLLRRWQPNMLHTHTPKAGLIGMLAGWLAGVPIRLHTVAGLPLMEKRGWKRWLLVQAERLTYACATAVYPNSVGLAEYIRLYIWKDESRIRMIGSGSSNGIDPAWFSRTPALEAEVSQCRQRLGIAPENFVWLYVGRLVREKGIGELVAAFTRLAKRYPGMRLVLVGPAETEGNFLPTEVWTTLRNHPAIRLTGYQSDVRPYLAMANALVFPSYREGFPNVPMQAACLGVPLILSDIIGCRELVTDGWDGLLVPPRNIRALETAMERLYQNPELRQAFARRARAHIVAHFPQERVQALLVKEYRFWLSEKQRT